jgi:hypothetical protein
MQPILAGHGLFLALRGIVVKWVTYSLAYKLSTFLSFVLQPLAFSLHPSAFILQPFLTPPPAQQSDTWAQEVNLQE